MKRFGLAAAAAALLAPGGALAFSPAYTCVFTTSCSADAGGCEGTKVTYGLKQAGGAWSVMDVYNGQEVKGVAAEAIDDAVSLRWKAGGVWNNELALVEMVLAADGAAAMSAIGRNDGRLGASVLTGRCEAGKAAER